MSEINIHCDDLFDGWQWRGPAVVDVHEATITGVRYGEASAPAGAVRIATLTPGLIDVGVSASGYADLPSVTDPFAPERAFARMCLRFGVTTIVDINNSPAPLAFLESLAATGDGPLVVHSAGRLASTPTGRHDITIDVRRVDRVLQWQQDSGAVLASLGAVDPEVLQSGGSSDRGPQNSRDALPASRPGDTGAVAAQGRRICAVRRLPPAGSRGITAVRGLVFHSTTSCRRALVG